MGSDRTPGIVSSQVSAEGFLVQRTLTAWDSLESMKDYVRSEPHLGAMKQFSRLANTSFTTHFESTQVPDWPEALAQLKAQPKIHQPK